MKKILPLIIITLLLSSCGEEKVEVPQGLVQLNNQKLKLKKQLDSITLKLKAVEKL